MRLVNFHRAHGSLKVEQDFIDRSNSLPTHLDAASRSIIDRMNYLRLTPVTKPEIGKVNLSACKTPQTRVSSIRVSRRRSIASEPFRALQRAM